MLGVMKKKRIGEKSRAIGELKNPESPHNSITPQTRETLLKNGYILRTVNKSRRGVKYAWTQKREICFTKDYNMLENLYMVRRYIQARYQVKIGELEVLIYLYPKQYFKFDDYVIIQPFLNRNIDRYIDSGLFRLVVEGKKLRNNVYTLSLKGKSIVKMFYACLSGERKIDVDHEKSPIKNDTAYRRAVNESLRVVKELDQSSKKVYYEEEGVYPE